MWAKMLSSLSSSEHAGLNDHDVFLRPIASPGLSALYFFDDVETFQHTTCFPVNHGVAAVVKKNCEPFVFGPALAMAKTPGPVNGILKFSSAKFLP
ncbi:unnamed protein product [Bathycoccus prasinos]